jgi:hypothetical protein
VNMKHSTEWPPVAAETTEMYTAYLTKVEKAVGRLLTDHEFPIVWSHFCAGKGFRTAAREILRARNAT